MKRFTAFILIIVMVLGSGKVCAWAEEPAVLDWQRKYLLFLEIVRQFGSGANHADSMLHSYILYDIDQNTIPELILHFGSSYASEIGRIYRYRNGKMEFVHSFPFGGGYMASYPDGNGIIFGRGREYAQAMKLWVLTDNGIEEADTILTERVSGAPIYTKVDAVLPDSVMMKEFPGNEDLPIFTYDQWADWLTPRSGVTEGRGGDTERFPENDPAFFDKVICGERSVITCSVILSTVFPKMYDMGDPVETTYQKAEENLARHSHYYSEWQGYRDLDYSTRTVKTVDLNGDGQLEALISFTYCLDVWEDLQFSIILSEQDGIVYAYLFRNMSIQDADANGVLYRYYVDKDKRFLIDEFAFRFVFDREHNFLLTVPYTNYLNPRTVREQLP